MDQETALELVKKGGTLLLLDVPQGTLVGIDTQMFTVGPLFKGIKMIPPGPHFVYYSSSNREGSEFSPVVGFFVFTSASEVVVRRWHHQEERLVKLPEDEEERYHEAVKHLEFDKHLGSYPLDHYGEWKKLSNYITKDTIQRIEPVGGEITIAYESEFISATPKTAAEIHLSEQLRNSKFTRSVEGSQKHGCYYTHIPHVVKHTGLCGEGLTALNIDKSELLEMILMNTFGGAEELLLGELQFAYIAFLMGQSLQAFYQWKAVVSVLLSCTEAPLHSRSQLFSKFIMLVYHQLKYGFSNDEMQKSDTGSGISLFLDESWLSKDIFLHRLCKEFFSLIQEAQVIDGDLQSWTKKLKGLLEMALGWDFKDGTTDAAYDEDDEFSPVIVSLSETRCQD